MRVFINDKAVEVPRGARVRDAVAQADDGLARLLDSAAYVTDAAGRTIDAGDAVGEAGSVYRVVVSARREGKPRLTKDALRRWPKVELHVHLDGALRPATMLELARAQGIRLPADTPDALAKPMLGRDGVRSRRCRARLPRARPPRGVRVRGRARHGLHVSCG